MASSRETLAERALAMLFTLTAAEKAKLLPFQYRRPAERRDEYKKIKQRISDCYHTARKYVCENVPEEMRPDIVGELKEHCKNQLQAAHEILKIKSRRRETTKWTTISAGAVMQGTLMPPEARK